MDFSFWIGWSGSMAIPWVCIWRVLWRDYRNLPEHLPCSGQNLSSAAAWKKEYVRVHGALTNGNCLTAAKYLHAVHSILPSPDLR
jgi:hypothetical protein